MSRALNLQSQYLANTTNALEALEVEFDRLRHQAVNDLQALKAGEVSLENLVVTDDGWEFLPEPPAVPSSNGKVKA